MSTPTDTQPKDPNVPDSERKGGCSARPGSDEEYGEEFWCRMAFSESKCPFCGTAGLEVDYSSFGTDLYCADGCHGRFVFPCAPFEAWEMWQRNCPNVEVARESGEKRS